MDPFVFWSQCSAVIALLDPTKPLQDVYECRFGLRFAAEIRMVSWLRSFTPSDSPDATRTDPPWIIDLPNDSEAAVNYNLYDYTDSELKSFWIATLVVSGISIISAIFASYLFVRMRRNFRHE